MRSERSAGGRESPTTTAAVTNGRAPDLAQNKHRAHSAKVREAESAALAAPTKSLRKLP